MPSIGHKCAVPGCCSVMVIDGNMKNHRDVCKAKDAGYMEFDGLPNQIVTGCMNTPDYKSRYCKLHKDRACSLSVDDHTEDDTEGVIETILEKKSTRKATYYKVRLYACIFLIH